MAESQGQEKSATPQAPNAWDAVAAIFGQAEHRTEYLWPDCVPIWLHWQQLQTQWRTGKAGATGLDYAAVAAYMTEFGLDGEARRECFECIRACERATLQVWSELK